MKTGYKTDEWRNLHNQLSKMAKHLKRYKLSIIATESSIILLVISGL